MISEEAKTLKKPHISHLYILCFMRILKGIYLLHFNELNALWSLKFC